MPYQTKALNNETIEVFVKHEVLQILEISILPRGLVDVDIEQNLVKVVQAKGKAPVYMKLGKLLKANDYTDKEIREASATLKALSNLKTNTVKFARTQEEIIDVYDRGPHSCMRGKDCVQVYATPDLAVAYLEIDGDVKARAVVCVNEDIGLQYSTIYGFASPLEVLLKRLGYESGSLEGCRLLKIEDGDTYVAPFLDGIQSVTIEDDYLVIDSNGEEEASSQDGLLYAPVCNCCGDRITEDTSQYSEYLHETLCDDCYDKSHVYIDGQGSYHVEEDSIQQTEDGEWCLKEDVRHVECRDEYHHEDDVTYNSYTGEYYLKSDFDD